MATLSNLQYYKAGEIGASAVVGFESKLTRVVRYDLTIGSDESANRLTWLIDSGGYIGWGSYEANSTEFNDKVSLYFYIGTDPDEFANAGIDQVAAATGKVDIQRRSGNAVDENLTFNFYGEADIMLFPGKTYYLWIFPGYSNAEGGNGTWGWFSWSALTTNTITLYGAAGMLRIDTGSEIITAIPYIDSGEAWEQAIPYIDTGEDLKVCG